MKPSDISKIESKANYYSNLSKGIVEVKKYTYYAITHHSTSIEGSSLSESEVVNLLEYGKTAQNKPYLHHLMVSDHFNALEYIISQAKKKRPVSVDFIKEIGKRTMKNTGSLINAIGGTYDVANGDFRKSAVRAGNRIFPDYNKINALISKLCSETNKDLKTAKTFQQICEASFKVHFNFVSIHPFGDGNGRSSRLLMNYAQAYFNMPLSVVFKSDKIQYIEALEIARKKESLEPFYDFMFKQYHKFLNKEIKLMK